MTKTQLQVLILIPLFFIFSIYLVSPYIYGDQVSYRGLYEALSTANFKDIPTIGYFYTRSIDTVSFFILFIGAKLGINKDIYISIFNVILLVSLFLIAKRNNIKNLMIPMLFLNFYIIVLLTGAERLKFAYILILLSVLSKKRQYKYFFAVLSVLAHIQMVLLIISLFSSFLKKEIYRLLKFKISKKMIIQLSFFILLLLFLFYFKAEIIITKIKYYSNWGNFSATFKSLLLLTIGLVFLKNKVEFLLSMLFLIICTYFLGGERINMMTFTIFIYYFWNENKGNHPVLIVFMVYYGIKAIPFINNILTYGSGF